MQEKCISNGDEIGDENEVGIRFIPRLSPLVSLVLAAGDNFRGWSP